MTSDRPTPSPGAPPPKPALPKRFYEKAHAELRDGLHTLLLDGRGARTPGRRPIALRSAAAAAALAQEWDDQRPLIDPTTMPLTRIVNSALDGVADDMPAIAEDIVKYAGTDLLCYRAGEPDGLVTAQMQGWDPVLAWARTALGARFVLLEGIVFQPQPPEAIEAVRVAVQRYDDPVALAALHVMTTLSGSAILALAVANGALDQAEAWRLAHLDEAHQEAFWGADSEALERRLRRGEEFAAAARLMRLSLS